VLRALTKRAREAFRILATAKLEGKPTMNLKELYALALADFFASSEQELEGYIKELQDHKILRTKRRADGTDGLDLASTLNDAALRLLLSELD
jgi:hypothetical protein